mmetsp:Transcript_100986/g.253173  ORF Transcript_100986/g.253173 Transcript_100986/m.253173 type:complete len:267 (+) Transcript_100986:243-1043(+)
MRHLSRCPNRLVPAHHVEGDDWNEDVICNDKERARKRRQRRKGRDHGGHEGAPQGDADAHEEPAGPGLSDPPWKQLVEGHDSAADVDHVRKAQVHVDEPSKRAAQMCFFASPPRLLRSPPSGRTIRMHPLDYVLGAQISEGSIIEDHQRHEEACGDDKGQDRGRHQAPRFGGLALQSGHGDDDGEDEYGIRRELREGEDQAREAILVARPSGVIRRRSVAFVRNLVKGVPRIEAAPKDHDEDGSCHQRAQNRGLVEQVPDVDEDED